MYGSINSFLFAENLVNARISLVGCQDSRRYTKIYTYSVWGMGALTACLSLFLAASLRRPDASSLESVCMCCGVFCNIIFLPRPLHIPIILNDI